MMSGSCKRVLTLLSRYADGALDPADRARAELHVRSCSSCAATLKEYRAVNDFMVAPEPIEPSPYLWLRVRRALNGEDRRKPAGLLARLRPVLMPIAGAALVAVAVFTAGVLSQTITRTGQDAVVQSINIQPEDGTSPVSRDSGPCMLPDSLDDEE